MNNFKELKIYPVFSNSFGFSLNVEGLVDHELATEDLVELEAFSSALKSRENHGMKKLIKKL